MATAVKNKRQPTEAEMDAAIEKANQDRDAMMAVQREEEAAKQEKAVGAKSLAQQLYDEAQTGPSSSEVGGLDRVPADIWTLDRMRQRAPLSGDLYDDGKFVFTFKPVLGSIYCQDRYLTAKQYKEGDHASFVRMERAYAEIVYYAMQGCTWPVRETLDDPETGEPLLEDDGFTQQTRPLPITLENIKRMSLDMLTDFLIAMRRAVEGEASTTPSS